MRRADVAGKRHNRLEELWELSSETKKKIWFEQSQVQQLLPPVVKLGYAEVGMTTSGRARVLVSSVYGMLIAGICLSLSTIELIV
jgi:hypothetical protein